MVRPPTARPIRIGIWGAFAYSAKRLYLCTDYGVVGTVRVQHALAEIQKLLYPLAHNEKELDIR